MDARALPYLRAASQRAAHFLAARQEKSGAWRDYPQFPMGPSDGWVSAYVGRALLDYSRQGADPRAEESARRAAEWLSTWRDFSQGWGYNAASGPDADSTSHALSLLRAAGKNPRPEDSAWLSLHWRGNGGCATYLRRDAWGAAHIDVSPVALLALSPEERLARRDSFLEFSSLCRAVDGSWPAYWWRSCYYSTFWNLRALRALGVEVPPLEIASSHSTREIESNFDLAFALGVALLTQRPAGATAAALLHRQQPDGGWQGAPNLRITDPLCFRPWERSIGAFYPDSFGLITTASALLVLSNCLQTLAQLDTHSHSLKPSQTPAQLDTHSHSLKPSQPPAQLDTHPQEAP
jgi:hypothetical protein